MYAGGSAWDLSGHWLSERRPLHTLLKLSLLAELLILLPQRRKGKGWDIGQLVELLTEHAQGPGLL